MNGSVALARCWWLVVGSSVRSLLACLLALRCFVPSFEQRNSGLNYDTDSPNDVHTVSFLAPSSDGIDVGGQRCCNNIVDRK